MSCPHCEALALERTITSPDGLRAVLRDAATAVANQALDDRGCGDEGDPLSQCGQWFHLFAETYHGCGGAFAPCLTPVERDKTA